MHQCYYCEQIFDSKEDLYQHVEIHSDIERNKEPIFVGETNNLEKTFTNYVDTEFDGNECMKKTSFYQRVFTNDQKQKQLELMEVVKNETGKYPTCNTEIEIENS